MEKCRWVALARTEKQEDVAVLVADTAVFMLPLEDQPEYVEWFRVYLYSARFITHEW